MDEELYCPYCGYAIVQEVGDHWYCSNDSCICDALAPLFVWRDLIAGKTAQRTLEQTSAILNNAIEDVSTHWFPTLTPDSPADHEARRVIYTVLGNTLARIKGQGV